LRDDPKGFVQINVLATRPRDVDGALKRGQINQRREGRVYPFPAADHPIVVDAPHYGEACLVELLEPLLAVVGEDLIERGGVFGRPFLLDREVVNPPDDKLAKVRPILPGPTLRLRTIAVHDRLLNISDQLANFRRGHLLEVFLPDFREDVARQIIPATAPVGV